MGRILVIRGGAIGDFILTLPALQLLREAFPAAHIEVLGYKHIVALAEGTYAQAVRSIEYAALASFFSRGAELPQELAEYFGSFHQVISYLFDPDDIFATNLKRAGVKNLIVGPAKLTDEEHASRQLARPLEKLALFLDDAAAVVQPSAANHAGAAAILQDNRRPFVAIHPGSGGERKNWALENWQALGDAILKDNSAASLLVVGGEAEGPILAALRKHWNRNGVIFVENLPLPELAAVLAHCQLFIGHDSGISHLAAAVGTPAVLLFGPTDPAIWAPIGPEVRVIHPSTHRLSDVTVAEILAVAREVLAEQRAHPAG